MPLSDYLIETEKKPETQTKPQLSGPRPPIIGLDMHDRGKGGKSESYVDVLLNQDDRAVLYVRPLSTPYEKIKDYEKPKQETSYLFQGDSPDVNEHIKRNLRGRILRTTRPLSLFPKVFRHLTDTNYDNLNRLVERLSLRPGI